VLRSFPVRLWLATRIAIFAVAGLSVYLWPFVYTADGARSVPFSFGDGLCAWDCRAYADIARGGYGLPILTNFWPMLPLLARPLVWLHVSPVWAVVIVANVAALGAFVFVYRVFELCDGEEAARWGLTLFAVWPFAFFYGTGYTESVMVCAGAGGMYFALRGRHVTAGAVFAGGVLSRMPATLGWLGLAAVQLRDRPRDRRAWLGLAIPIAVFLLWPVFTWAYFGDALLPVHVRRHWGPYAYASVVKGMLRWRETRMELVYPVLALGPIAGAIGLARVRRWWPLAAIAVPQVALYLAVGAYGLGRYTGSVWPVYLPLGVWLARRPSWQTPVIIVACMLQAMFLQLHGHAYLLQ
jgi:hypothetical protein